MPAFAVAPQLPADVVARSHALPVKPAPVELVGQRIRLAATEPTRDAAALHAVSNGRALQIGARTMGDSDAEMLIWRYLPYGPFADLAAFTAYLENLSNLPDLRAMTVYDRATDHPIGVMTLMANHPQDLKIELGHIWIAPIMQGSGVITEAAYLMLGHCFELGYRRVEWKCDALNERSRRTALKLGFIFEGIQEYHKISRGRSRDTAWFRILDPEWPELHKRLEARLHS